MENKTDKLIAEMRTTALFNKKTKEPLPPDERADNLDAIRLRILEMFDSFENIDEIKLRLIFGFTLQQVSDTYIDINREHEELLAAGR